MVGLIQKLSFDLIESGAGAAAVREVRCRAEDAGFMEIKQGDHFAL